MKKYFIFGLIISIFSFVIINICLAEEKVPVGEGQLTPKCDTCLINPLGEGVIPQTLIGKIINGALGIVGSLALVMFIYGGFTWMLAAGNAEKVKKGKDILIWATIGLVIIFSSYALVKFVIEGVTKQ